MHDKTLIITVRYDINDVLSPAVDSNNGRIISPQKIGVIFLCIGNSQ